MLHTHTRSQPSEFLRKPDTIIFGCNNSPKSPEIIEELMCVRCLSVLWFYKISRLDSITLIKYQKRMCVMFMQPVYFIFICILAKILWFLVFTSTFSSCLPGQLSYWYTVNIYVLWFHLHEGDYIHKWSMMWKSGLGRFQEVIMQWVVSWNVW